MATILEAQKKMEEFWKIKLNMKANLKEDTG